MADMKDDVAVPVTWTNAHTLAGIGAGLALQIQNKGAFALLAKISDTQPGAGTVSGFRIVSNAFMGSSLGDTVWVRAEGGTTTASIQEA